MGLKSFLTTSEGEHVENPRWFRASEKKIRWHHKQVDRRKKGSKRRKKAVADLAKVYQTVARQRLDYHHKEANKLVAQNDVIYHAAERSSGAGSAFGESLGCQGRTIV